MTLISVGFKSLVVRCLVFFKASYITPHLQKLRPQSGIWHPRVYDCKKLIHSLAGKLTGTSWNSILWGVLAVALALVLKPKSSVIVTLSTRSLLNYAICFFGGIDYKLVDSFGDCSNECACTLMVWWIPPELPILAAVRRKDDRKVYWEENLDLSSLPVFSEKEIQACVGDLSLKQHGKRS